MTIDLKVMMVAWPNSNGSGRQAHWVLLLLGTHTHTHNRFTALWNLSGTTRVSRYQKKHSPTTLHCYYWEV